MEGANLTVFNCLVVGSGWSGEVRLARANIPISPGDPPLGEEDTAVSSHTPSTLSSIGQVYPETGSLLARDSN